jgi:hypothetical protein
MDQTPQSNTSKFQQAYAKLEAMRFHVPDIITEPLVVEYNGLVDHLAECDGEDLTAFRVADSELRTSNDLSYMNDFNAETYKNVKGPRRCDRDLFLRRIDGLLMHLQPQNRAPKFAIGFAR